LNAKQVLKTTPRCVYELLNTFQNKGALFTVYLPVIPYVLQPIPDSPLSTSWVNFATRGGAPG